MRGTLFGLAVSAGVVLAQGPGVRDPDAYPARAGLGNATLAAEYLVHSLPTAHGSLFTPDYLVVEAMYFGSPGTRMPLSASHFTLRLNGRKTPIFPQTPGVVAAGIRNPEWAEPRPRLTAGAGVGNAGVIFGPPAVERFPGDPTVRRPRPPVTVPPPAGGVEKEPPPPLDELVQQAAMPEGERSLPAGGLLFFAFKGKAESIEWLELIYEGPAGKAVLKLP
jgi:hypothetical protein